MNKLFYYVIILMIFSISLLFNQETKIIKSGKQYLVIIALDKYKNRLPLQDHVKNAKSIKNILYSKYVIDEVIELYNYDATSKNIQELFIKLQRDLKKDDSLLLYYAGHGYLDKKINEVYWLPYDAGINEYIKDLWLSNNDLIKYLDKLNAKQIFVISDSCFNSNLIEPIIIDEKMSFTNEYFSKSYSNKSRQILSSGILETSFEKSEFSELLNTTLKRIKKEYIDPVFIYNEIKDKISKSNIIYGSIKDLGHQTNASLVLFQREKELEIKEEEEIVEKELKEVKEQKIVSTRFARFKDLSTINKSGRVLLITSAPICGIGLILLGVDFAYMFTVLKNEMYEGTSYENYVRTYRIHINMFISSVVVSSVGLLGIIISIPLNVVKGDFKRIKKDKVSLNLNMELNKDLSFYVRYRF